MTPEELRLAAAFLSSIAVPPTQRERETAATLAAKLRALADERSPKPYDQRKIHGPNL